MLIGKKCRTGKDSRVGLPSLGLFGINGRIRHAGLEHEVDKVGRLIQFVWYFDCVYYPLYFVKALCSARQLSSVNTIPTSIQLAQSSVSFQCLIFLGF